MDMNNETLIEQKILETKRYEFNDGLRDIQIGIYLMWLGVVQWMIFEPGWWRLLFNIRETTGKITMMAASFFVILIPALFAWGFLRLMETIRRRWLWRDSGVVKTSRWVMPRWATIFSGVVMLGSLGLGLLFRDALAVDEFYVWRLLFAAAGLAFAVSLVAMGAHLELKRYYFIGLIGGLVSALSLLFVFTPGLSSLLFFGVWSLLMYISGCIALVRNISVLKAS